MRFIEPQWRSCEQIVYRPGRPYSARGAVAEIEFAFRTLACLARLHWIFAISEISKGVAIVTIGDMVIAEDLGEVVRIAATALPEMRGATRSHRPGWLERRARRERNRTAPAENLRPQ
jgi:hypothetical protein